MIPEDLSFLGVLQGVHIRDGLDLQWSAVAFCTDDTVLLPDANRDTRGPVDASESNWPAAVYGQGVGHPEAMPSLAIDHCCGDAGEGALERPDEVFDCLLRGGPGQGGESWRLPGERKEHRDAHDLWPIGTTA
jgi:hypothetical protein